MAVHDRGVALLSLGALEEALESFELMESAARSAFLRGTALMNQGYVQYMLDLDGLPRLREAHRLLNWHEPNGFLAATNLALALSEHRDTRAEARELANDALAAAVRESLGDQRVRLSGLVGLGTAVIEWDRAEARKVLRRTYREARRLGLLSVCLSSGYQLARIELIEGNVKDFRKACWRFRREAQRAETRVPLVDADLYLAFSEFLVAQDTTSRLEAARHARWCQNRIVPALLASIALLRQTQAQPLRRSGLEWSGHWGSIALDVSWALGDAATVAGLIEYLGCVGIPEESRMDREESWRTLANWEPWQLTAPVGQRAQQPSAGIAEYAVAMGRADNQGDYSERFPLGLPPRIRMPDGSWALSRPAELAWARYQIGVFSDTSFSIGSVNSDAVPWKELPGETKTEIALWWLGQQEGRIAHQRDRRFMALESWLTIHSAHWWRVDDIRGRWAKAGKRERPDSAERKALLAALERVYPESNAAHAASPRLVDSVRKSLGEARPARGILRDRAVPALSMVMSEILSLSPLFLHEFRADEFRREVLVRFAADAADRALPRSSDLLAERLRSRNDLRDALVALSDDEIRAVAFSRTRLTPNEGEISATRRVLNELADGRFNSADEDLSVVPADVLVRRALGLVHVGSSPRLELPDDEWKQVLDTCVTTITRELLKAVPAMLGAHRDRSEAEEISQEVAAELTVRLRRHLIRMFLAGQGSPPTNRHFTGPGRARATC